MIHFLVISLIIFQFSYAQQIIPLNSFKGGNVLNKINATPPYSLYLSAQMDTSIVLSQIFVRTEDNQLSTLEDLKYSKASDTSGQLVPMKIQTNAVLLTSLADNQMAALEGFLYVTTTKQSTDHKFKVFNVNQTEMIRTTFLICDPCTMVFLNSNTKNTPVKSSTISTWRQSTDSTVTMYRGIPTDDQETDSTQILSNPMQGVKNEEIRFSSVEKFSVSLETFYFKTTADFYFAIQPIFTDLDQYTTTGYTTTGLYMKSRDQVPKNITVFCVQDTRYNGTTGANILGNLPNNQGKLFIDANDYDQSYGLTITPAKTINGWTINKIGQNLTINGVHTQDGEYFVQYFIQQDQQISGTYAPTLEPSRTTRSMETTTKMAGAVNWMMGIIVMSLSLVL